MARFSYSGCGYSTGNGAIHAYHGTTTYSKGTSFSYTGTSSKGK